MFKMPDILLIAAIDLGTSFSTWAYSTYYELRRDKLIVHSKHWPNLGDSVSEKAPTCLLIRPDNTTCFGYDALREYGELSEENKHTEYSLFKNFKMHLYGQKIDRNLMITDEVSGKKQPALKIFAEAIKYLKNDLTGTAEKSIATNGETNSLTDEEYRWVLTVPAIWDDAAKQFMREAANQAGIKNEQLVIALEPEAASLYCRLLPTLNNDHSMSSISSGHKYLILDAGGGTIDITVHEVCDGDKLKEVHKASGGDWGGRRVDQEFEKFLSGLFGKGTIDKLKKEAIDYYLYLMDCFEMRKRVRSNQIGKKITIRMPEPLKCYLKGDGKDMETIIQYSKFKDKLTLKQDKLFIDYDLFISWFDISLTNTIAKVKEIFAHEDVISCKTILMVGGFSGSLIVQNAIKEAFPDVNVVIPPDPELSIVKGAVIYGHDPTIIVQRKLKYTYGTSVAHEKKDTCTHAPTRIEDLFGEPHCTDIFSAHVRVGDVVKHDEEIAGKSYVPVNPFSNKTTVHIYRSTRVNPELVTDESCTLAGTLELPITPLFVAVFSSASKENIGIDVSFMFGGTEIKVKGVDKMTKKSIEVKLNCLDDDSDNSAATK